MNGHQSPANSETAIATPWPQPWPDGREMASGPVLTSPWGWEADVRAPSTNGTDAPVEEGNPSGVISEGQQHWEVPFLASVCVFGVLGNLVVVAVYSKKAFRQSNAALYILNLAAGDLFLLVVVVALHITEYYPATWPVLWRHDAQCILHRFGRFVGFNVTIFTMVAIAIDRYVAVCHSLVFRATCTPARTRLVILVIWVLAALTAAPCVINFGVKYQAGVYSVNFVGKTPFACRAIFIGTAYGNFKVIFVSIVLFWVPVIVTAASYTLLVVFVWKNNKKFRRCTSSGRHLRSHWKAARTLCMVFCVYLLTYVFLATYTLVRQYGLGAVPPLVQNVGLLLPYANSCMNPVVYSLANQGFRKACSEIFWKRSGEAQRPAVRASGQSGTGQQGTASVCLSGSNGNLVADPEKAVSGSSENGAGCNGEAFENLAFRDDRPNDYGGFDSVM